jgi:hypothetical protein
MVITEKQDMLWQYFGAFLFIILCMTGIVQAVTCPDDNNIQVIQTPCEVLTPAAFTCSGNATIQNPQNLSQQYNASMFLKYPESGIYNFTFNYSDVGQYLIRLCDNSTALINVYVETASTTIINPANIISIGTPDANQTQTAIQGALRNQFSELGGNFLTWAKKYVLWIVFGVLLAIIAIFSLIKSLKKEKMLK